MARTERKPFFSEEKKQKTFILAAPPARAPECKSSLVLSFTKEHHPFAQDSI
jgi:hypothetical protein